MARITLFDLKEKLATLNAAIASDAEWIAEKAADPATSMDDINAKKAHRDELVTRRDMLKAQHDEMEKAQRAAVSQKHVDSGNPEAMLLKGKAEFYRAALTGRDPSEIAKTYEGLGAIPEGASDLGYGENLLPTNMTNELITEPFETNSLRGIEQVSQITGLEEPKLIFDIEDADLEDVTDKDTANEIKMEGDTVSYGRFKTKITATVKDTVLHGNDVNLVTTIENGLRSGLAQKEKMRAFSTNADPTHEHMSFYMNGIKAVAGDNLINAIIKAIGDLPDSFSENATVVMRRSDYFAAVEQLANGAVTLWGKKPEDVIGYPVVFNDRAVIPVIGDFRYARLNYDIGTIYETDKDARKGEYYFVLTAWGDHRIKLKSAFRTAYVRTQLIGATIVGDNTPPEDGDKLKATGVFNDGGTGSDGTVTYAWEYLNGTTWASASAWSGYNTNTITTVTTTDDGVSFRCKITYADDDGTSEIYTTPVTLA